MLDNRGHIDQKAVAKASGVSRSTVGAILCAGASASHYSEETRKRVLEVAARLNYRPNRAAQAMRNQRSNLIGIVHYGTGIEAAHKTNLALAKELNAVGYDYLAIDMDWYGGGIDRTLTELIRARVEGILISHIQEVFSDQHIKTLLQAGISVVSINGQDRAGIPLIGHDVAGAIKKLTRHLLDKGHRLIWNLAYNDSENPDLRVLSRNPRTLGFRRAIEERGVWRSLPENEVSKAWPPLGGNGVMGFTIHKDKRFDRETDQPIYSFCKRLLGAGKIPDAIVCPNDAGAIAMILAAQEFGLSVPRDFAVTGYDNDSFGRFPAIGLTTAEQDTDRICAAAVEALMKCIENPGIKIPNKTFPSTLITRTSCRGPAVDALPS